jgi:hypothetical protein
MAAIIATGCTKDVNAPLDPETITFSIVRGDQQTGTAGEQLPKPLVVRAWSGSTGVPGIAANFVVTSGGGSVFVTAVNTDAQGFAKNYWTLGTDASVPESVVVRAVMPNGNKRTLGVFTATAVAGPPDTVAFIQGMWQSAKGLSTLQNWPIIRFVDHYGNPVRHYPVLFTALNGGYVQNPSVSTDTFGLASPGLWTIGPRRGLDTLVANSLYVLTAQGLGDAWAPRASMSTARNGPSVVALDGTVYAVGGFSDDVGHALADVEAYDTLTDTWSSRAPMPTPRGLAATVAWGGKLYAIGGADFNGLVNAVEVYDPASDSWTTSTPMPTPCPGRAVAGVQQGVQPTILVVCWTAVQAFDPVQQTWSARASLPGPLVEGSAVDYYGTLYIANVNVAGNPEGLRYDPNSDTWTPIAPVHPGTYADFSLVAAHGELLAIGSSDGSTWSTQVYDPNWDTWITKEPMPAFVPGSGAVGVGDVVYAVGGFNLVAMSRALIYWP